MEYLQRSSSADERIVLDYEQIFGNDSGEDEDPRVLAAYFVELQSFRRAYEVGRKLDIVRARKGMGKSALLTHLQYRLTQGEKPLDPTAVVVKVTGNDLLCLADFSSTDSSVIENRWKQVICKRVSMELASQIGFAASDDAMALVEAAEIEGYKGRNLVSSLMNRLGKMVEGTLKGITGVGVGRPDAADSKALPYEQILSRIQTAESRNVWLLIDDVDAKFVDTPALQTRVGAFFSAIRSLAFGMEGLRIRASVRTDVWTNLRAMEDQDKLRQYVSEIKWSEEHLKKIFAKRILSFLQREDAKRFGSWNETDDYARILAQVFEGDFRMGAEKKSDPLNVVIALAGRRPRWMAQLCKLAGEAAGTALIQQRHFHHVMSSFGKEKVSDLIKEHSHQFADLQKVTDAFRGSARTNSRFKLTQLIDKGYVQKMAGSVIPTVNGFPYVDVDQICELLYQVDFIVGEKGGRVVPFHEDPTLFRSEANQQNKIGWVVNLSYRSFLDIQHG